MENKTEATHYVVDLYQIENKSIDNEDFCLDILHRAVEIAGQKIINTYKYKPDANKISIKATFLTGHCNLCTWPEQTYCAIDFYGCDGEALKKGIDCLINSLNPKKIRMMELKRGNEHDN